MRDRKRITSAAYINMNAALVTQFLSLINPTFKTCYELTQLSHPNAPFLNVFDFFMQKYKRINEQDCTHNNLIMHAKWTPTDGFEKLVSQINIGMMYTQYANHPIPDQETVDTFIMVIMKCGFSKHPMIIYMRVQTKTKHGPKQQFFLMRR